MLNRDMIKKEIDSLPDSVIEKLQEFIEFQKFSISLFDYERTNIRDIAEASISSIGFWDNQDDEVWDHV